jgi:hypothetical protein
MKLSVRYVINRKKPILSLKRPNTLVLTLSNIRFITKSFIFCFLLIAKALTLVILSFKSFGSKSKEASESTSIG